MDSKKEGKYNRNVLILEDLLMGKAIQRKVPYCFQRVFL